MTTVNKNHWYDGKFYDRFVAPNQKKLFTKIIKMIEPDKSIVDVGCGTGFFSFSVVDKCKSVIGIDLSRRNINKANQNLNAKPTEKMSFIHTSLNDLVLTNHIHFDYAVTTYVIHEVNESERVQMLMDMSKIADKIIIGDFLVPRPNNLAGKLTRVIEFVAGAEHYRNFRNFVANGGIPDLANKAGLQIILEHKNQNTGNHIAILSN